MAERRSVILEATKRADEIHEIHGFKDTLTESPGSVDVFGVYADRSIPYIFRPLDGLLGAYICHPARGVIISTTRPLLTVQRFTAAHELGHVLLEHDSPSFDDENVIARSPWESAGRRDYQELAANIFASQLLMPKWLIVAHAKRQGWSASDFRDPKIIYQLSLRLGTSYAATCHTLFQATALTSQQYNTVKGVSVKSIKKTFAGDVTPETWHSNFWLITDHDDEMSIETGVLDRIIFHVSEHSSGGYRWDVDALDGPLAQENDWREDPPGDEIGGTLSRRISVVAQARGRGTIRVSERRPWMQSETPLNSINLDCDITAPMQAGLPDIVRRQMLGIA